MAIIIECDRCKAQVRDKADYETFNVGSKEKHPEGSFQVHGHLCHECAVAVVRFINQKGKSP